MHTIQTDRLIGFSDLSIESGLLKAVYPESYEPDIFGGSSGLTGRESQFQFYTKNNLNDEVCHIIVMWKREKRPEVAYGTNDPYQYCPPFVSEQSIRDDMNALPPGKTMTDKYYVGYYDEDRLIAVMDLIIGFPDKTTAFIGFFMTEVDAQGKGLGSALITELSNAISGIGIKEVRLGWVKGNPQAEHFWKKNGFAETGATNETDKYTVVVARRGLL